ncbi:hypothetical protein [Rikenella microfusus]|uniref:hypothetical protein n=1 Tax=Rikenella microfusus TaxID=28139 RepID=UPI00248E8DF3|nr:hypothetical protein [Rikenella microfusus]
MSFAGTVLDMIRRSEANRAALQARRNRINDLRSRYIGQYDRHRLLVDKEISPEELQRIKQEIRRQIRRERIRTRVLTVVVGTMAAVLVVLVMLFVLGKIKV